MTYSGDLEQVARVLGVVGIHGSAELSQRDLDIALVARAGVLELAVTVQFELTGLRVAPPGALGSQLETHPAAAFAHALSAYPAVRAQVSPADALGTDADSDVGRAWQRIARHAISATHHWTTGSVRPSGPVAWAGLADIAAVSAVVSELDGELADAANRLPGRQDAARQLAAGTTSGLRTAARQVCELAAAGPLPDRGPEPRPMGNRGLVTITVAADVATAHEQLSNLLRTSQQLRAVRLGLMVIGQLRTCRALLDVVPEWQADLRAALQQHAQALEEISRQPVQVASIHAGDPRPVQQMQIIRQAVIAGSPLLSQLSDDPAEVARAASAFAGVTCALRETADRQLGTGAWLLPDSRSEALRWVQTGSWHEVPGQLQALRSAAVQAEQVTKAADSQPKRPTREGAPARTPLAARSLLLPAPFRPLITSRYGERPVRPGQPVMQPGLHTHLRRR